MGRILSWLGVLLGIVIARASDAIWVTWWYGGNRQLGVPIQPALDAVGLAIIGLLAGRLGLWLAGSSARGVGTLIAIALFAMSVVDMLVGIANQPWWHEIVTVLTMVPAAALGGGARLPRRRRGPVAQPVAP
jgi:hypothetical protein